MSDFTNIIAPLPFGEAFLKAMGVALRVSPTIATAIYVVFMVWEVRRRQWIQVILEAKPLQWIADHIWFPQVVEWFITGLVLTTGYLTWFWMLLIVKHAQLCFLGVLPCGPCPTTIQSLLLPIEALFFSLVLLKTTIDRIYVEYRAACFDCIMEHQAALAAQAALWNQRNSAASA